MTLNFKTTLSIALMSALISAPPAIVAHTPNEILNSQQPSLAPMLDKVTPAVVNIAVEKILPAGNSEINPAATLPKTAIGVGSGIIIDAKKGYIITNAHVISNAEVMVITLKDGRRFLAKLIGKDSGFDLAVIQIQADHLQQIVMGDSDKTKVGDFVAAIGSPFGLSQTVTSGVVSALHRAHPRIEGFQSFIQTDAPINPGNSGGALVDMYGQLVGVNTAILAPVDGANAGIGFAIPSNMVQSVAEQLILYGKVKRGMLGVIAQNITADLADAMGIKRDNGALVTEVVPGSPADKAGVKVEDVIEKINGKNVESATQLRNTLGLKRPGTRIQLTILRQHRELQIAAELVNPSILTMERELPFLAGLSMQKFNELEGDGNEIQGVLITNMTETCPGALAGLIPGDVIIRANDQLVNSVEALEKIATEKPQHLLVEISREHKNLFLVVQPNN